MAIRGQIRPRLGGEITSPNHGFYQGINGDKEKAPDEAPLRKHRYVRIDKRSSAASLIYL
jgi:hypothetical protein